MCQVTASAEFLGLRKDNSIFKCLSRGKRPPKHSFHWNSLKYKPASAMRETAGVERGQTGEAGIEGLRKWLLLNVIPELSLTY